MALFIRKFTFSEFGQISRGACRAVYGIRFLDFLFKNMNFTRESWHPGHKLPRVARSRFAGGRVTCAYRSVSHFAYLDAAFRDVQLGSQPPLLEAPSQTPSL